MSSNGSPSSATPTTEPAPAKTERSSTDKIADLLREKKDTSEQSVEGKAPYSSADGRPAEPSPGDSRPALELEEEDGEETGKETRQQRTLREFAEEAGISVKQLMKLVATDPDESDEPMSLGQLKDHWRETRQFQNVRDEFETWQETAQNEVTVARRQVQDLFQRIASVVPPQTLARVFGDVQFDGQEAIKKERAQVLEYYPEWRDAQVMVRDRDRITETLKTYGFTKYDVGMIQDSRIIKFVMDAIKLRERYERRRQGTVEARPTIEGPSRKGHRPSTDQQAKELAARGDIDGGIRAIVAGAMRNGSGKSGQRRP